MLVTREASQRRIDYFVPIRNAIDIYSAIPVPFRFYAIITPKAGWLSEYSIESFTSPTGTSGAARGALLGIFKKSSLYYRIRDWLTLTTPRRHMLARILKSEHVLASGRRWSPLPPSGKIFM